MGKIFNALEKYKKERKTTARPGKLKPADFDPDTHAPFNFPEPEELSPPLMTISPRRNDRGGRSDRGGRGGDRSRSSGRSDRDRR